VISIPKAPQTYSPMIQDNSSKYETDYKFIEFETDEEAITRAPTESI